MKDYHYGANKLTLIDVVSLIASGSKNPFYFGSELLDAFNNLPVVFRDAMLVMTMSSQNCFDSWRWLDLLEFVSPENRETAMLAAIHERRVREKRNPVFAPAFWLLIVCQYAEKWRWTIREEWVAELRALVTLREFGYFSDYPFESLMDEAKKWLEKFDKRNKEE